MKKLLIFGLIIGGIADATVAMATAPADGQLLTSKKYVTNELATKQKAIGSGGQGGSGSNGDVVTYTATAGTVSSKPVYNATTSTYSAQQNSLIEAKNVNAAVQNGLNSHITCHTWDDPQNPTDCWLWEINTLNGTYVPEPAQQSGV